MKIFELSHLPWLRATFPSRQGMLLSWSVDWRDGVGRGGRSRPALDIWRAKNSGAASRDRPQAMVTNRPTNKQKQHCSVRHGLFMDREVFSFLHQVQGYLLLSLARWTSADVKSASERLFSDCPVEFRLKGKTTDCFSYQFLFYLRTQLRFIFVWKKNRYLRWLWNLRSR